MGRMSCIWTRRRFLQRTTVAVTAAGTAAPSLMRVFGAANEKVNVGFVGVANRAAENLSEISRITDHVNVVALCDVDDNYLAQAKQKHPGARTYSDFRRLLDQRDIDAVVVSTPDHTHAVVAAAALRTNRHVYCEKPLTRTISECRLIEQLTLKQKLITQLGTQIHAGDNYRRVVELVHARAVGAVREVHVWVSASYGGMNMPMDKPPIPAGLRWDLWLGPVGPYDYHPEFAPAKWRNWWAFGGGSLADFGCHFMDLPHWALDLRHPVSVEAIAGPPVHPDSTPPWAIVRYEYAARPGNGTEPARPPVVLTWYHGGKQPPLLDEEQSKYFRSGVLFVGDKGMLLADYTRRQLLPEKDFADFRPPAQSIPKSVGHHREWIEAIRTGGTTTCNFDYSGVLTEAALLGNVAYRVGRKIAWNAARLRATGCPEADRYIRHQYRKGWRL